MGKHSTGIVQLDELRDTDNPKHRLTWPANARAALANTAAQMEYLSSDERLTELRIGGAL